MVFFFSSRRRHTRYIGDWSSDVCSSDLNSCNRLPSESSFSHSFRARSSWPISTSAETSQNEQMVKVPSSVARPSSVSSTRRSEERRVGKECNSGGSQYDSNKKENDVEDD